MASRRDNARARAASGNNCLDIKAAAAGQARTARAAFGDLGSGGRNRTGDLRIMIPSSSSEIASEFVTTLHPRCIRSLEDRYWLGQARVYRQRKPRPRGPAPKESWLTHPP